MYCINYVCITEMTQGGEFLELMVLEGSVCDCLGRASRCGEYVVGAILNRWGVGRDEITPRADPYYRLLGSTC